MTEKAGILLLLKVWDGAAYTTLGGLRTKQYTLESTEIDVTNHGSSEWKTLIDGHGIKHMKISGAGVHNGGATLNLVEDHHLANTLTLFQIVDSDTSGRTYQGSFKILSFERGSTYDKEQTFAIALESSGAITVS